MNLRPTKSEFLELARRHDVVPVIHQLTSDTVTPFTVFSQLSKTGRNPFLLESVEGGERVARYSFIGADPWRILEIRGGVAFVDGVPQEGDPIDILRSQTEAGSVAPVEDVPPFGGGAVGHVGYDAIRLVEDIPDSGRDETGLPEA
ncbi:MAG: anthranilate synthase component I, partial [Acidobacteriota bacterium]